MFNTISISEKSVMALQVIGAGFGRTGTLSVCTALNQLGFPCYHMHEVLGNKENKSHLGFWRSVASSEPGTQHDWNKIFTKYTATVDNPACCVWRELLIEYPDAKVLLTLHPRGAEVWYESTLDTIYFTERMWQFKVLKLATPFGRKFGEMSRKLIWQRSHKGTMNDHDKAIAHYNRHIEDVKAAVSPDRLLIFSVDQGWKPLCDFLGVPVPVSEFPNVNDRKEMKKILRDMTRGAYVILGVAAAVVAALIYGGFRLFF
ncbi:MAG: sulfotransferase family protein [Gammaproteobacteria bacterium]